MMRTKKAPRRSILATLAASALLGHTKTLGESAQAFLDASLAARAIPKTPKYGNVRTQVGEYAFDSAREAARYRALRLMLHAGEISNLAMQVPFEILPAVEIAGKRHRARRYIADFVYTVVADGRRVVEDVKGFRTPEYLLKRHMMKALLGIEIKEV